MRLIDADWLLDIVENIIKWDTERDRNRIIHQVRELTPTVTPEQRWIPCSESLPEKSGRYLVTIGLKTTGPLWNRVYIANYSDLMGLKSNKIWYQGNVGKSDFERLDDVVSWMPLLAPWKGGQIMVKVFTTNKDGKIEFTKEELEALLNEVWTDGYNRHGSYWWTSPTWTGTGTVISSGDVQVGNSHNC